MLQWKKKLWLVVSSVWGYLQWYQTNKSMWYLFEADEYQYSWTWFIGVWT